MKVVDLTAPFVEAVRVALLCKLSRPMAKKVFITFRAVVSYAQRKGHVAQNVAASAESIEISSRDEHKLEVGVDIPSRKEVRRGGRTHGRRAERLRRARRREREQRQATSNATAFHGSRNSMRS